MFAPLPDQPNLDRLGRQAKELRDAAHQGDPNAAERITRQLSQRPADSITLAAAQLVIAREYGFASWPTLKAAVDAAQGTPPRGIEGFLTATVEGRTRLATGFLDAYPAIARANIFTAAAVGDADRVAELLTQNLALAVAVDDERGWRPLLYVCNTHWHRLDIERTSGMTETARLFLDAGASPNTTNGGLPNRGYRSALHGSAATTKPGVARLVLEQAPTPTTGCRCARPLAGPTTNASAC